MDLICGINPVIEALAAGTRHFDRLLIVKGLRNRRVSEAIARASQKGIPLRFEARETLDRMSGGLPHQGIIAVVSARPVIGLEDLLASAREPGLVVVLDGVEDPRNLGAILRNVEATGADGVVLPERHSAGLSETVGRASAGALEHVRVARVGNVVQALEALKARGFWIVGFEGEARERWDAVDYRRPVALVFGGEGRGIRRLVKEHCDNLVALPLFGHVSSLNVSVAAGIGLYEVIRQRGSVPSQVKPIPLRPAPSQKSVIAPGPEDREQDPGWVAQGLHEGPAEVEEAEPVSVVRIDEDHWSGPTVLRPAGGPPRHRRPGHHAEPPPRQRPAGPASPADRSAPIEHSDEAGRGRRRRHRRRRGGGEAPTAAGGPQAVAKSGGGGPSQAPAEAGIGPSEGSQRRRRRRRRRR